MAGAEGPMRLLYVIAGSQGDAVLEEAKEGEKWQDGVSVPDLDRHSFSNFPARSLYMTKYGLKSRSNARDQKGLVQFTYDRSFIIYFVPLIELVNRAEGSKINLKINTQRTSCVDKTHYIEDCFVYFAMSF